MKKICNGILKPYWFLESPIDREHKYYILMAYLIKVKEHFNKPGFEQYFKGLLVLKRDLLCFIKSQEISQRSLGNMTELEKEEFYVILDKVLENIPLAEEIAKESLKIIEEFLDSNIQVYQKYNSLVDVESYAMKYDLWDQGFLVIRKRDEKFLRIFNWFFSIIKIGDNESLALLMTELLDPKCPMTVEISKIKEFLKINTKDFSGNYDCILVGEVSNEIDLDIGVEIGKEKSIEIIMTRFRDSK